MVQSKGVLGCVGVCWVCWVCWVCAFGWVTCTTRCTEQPVLQLGKMSATQCLIETGRVLSIRTLASASHWPASLLRAFYRQVSHVLCISASSLFPHLSLSRSLSFLFPVPVLLMMGLLGSLVNYRWRWLGVYNSPLYWDTNTNFKRRLFPVHHQWMSYIRSTFCKTPFCWEKLVLWTN